MYIGRFAPSPTGALHFGSLVAAVASYLDAKANQGQWIVRMEDLDRPREMPGAADAILRALESFGFEWHGHVMYQSQRTEAYAAALEILQQQNLVYPCSCSRKEIADSATHGIDGLVYPGTCRGGLLKNKTARASRIQVPAGCIVFDDAIQGQLAQELARDVGDFVLKRADGLFAYQLAVVVDDAEQGITHVVRGADLLASTPRQIYLQQRLGYLQPHYAHLPVANNLIGEKLSKQTLARPLDLQNLSQQLWQALNFLGQQPPANIAEYDLENLWQWACKHWQIRSVPNQRSLTIRDC